MWRGRGGSGGAVRGGGGELRCEWGGLGGLYRRKWGGGVGIVVISGANSGSFGGVPEVWVGVFEVHR